MALLVLLFNNHSLLKIKVGYSQKNIIRHKMNKFNKKKYIYN